MTLGEILIAIVREMLGMPAEKKPPPRRRAPPAPSSPAWDDVAVPDVNSEEPAPYWEPERKPDAAVPTPVALRIAQADAADEYARMGGPGSLGGPVAMPETEATPAKAPISRARGPRAALTDDFIGRIINNPAAAREAFVYSEVFGPPKADRE